MAKPPKKQAKSTRVVKKTKAPKRKKKFKPAKPAQIPPAPIAPIATTSTIYDQTPIPKEVDNLDELSPDGLSWRQIAFVEHYLGRARLNATKAAELAGYSATSRASLACQGSRLLCNAKVQSRVRARVRGLGLDPREVLARIGLLSGSSMGDMLTARDTKDGEVEIGLDLNVAAQNGALELIAEYTEEDGGEGIIRRKVKVHNPKPYLDLLAKHYGLVADADGTPAGAVNRASEDKMTDAELLAYHQEHGLPIPDSLQKKLTKA